MKTYQFNTLDDIANYFENRGKRERAEAQGLKPTAKKIAHAHASVWLEAAEMMRKSAVRCASPRDDDSNVVRPLGDILTAEEDIDKPQEKA